MHIKSRSGGRNIKHVKQSPQLFVISMEVSLIAIMEVTSEKTESCCIFSPKSDLGT